MDNTTYSLYEKIDKQARDLAQFKNVLTKLENVNPIFRHELNQIETKPRDDNTTLSEKRRAELTELLVSYLGPLMDRHQHDTHLQTHRKYLERLAKARRQDAIIRGLSPKGINAEDMANYSFTHAANKGVNFGSGQGLSPNKGLDPETGEYTIILKYEGLLTISLFKEYIRKYTSSGKIDLYETIKSFFTAGRELGLTKAQVGQLLINLLDTKEVRESPDKLTADIFKSEMSQDPHKTILRIIKMVSRNMTQAYEIKDRLKEYKRPEGMPIEICITTLETICEEYFRLFLPGAPEEKRRRKVDELVIRMLPDLVDTFTRKQLRLHRRENDNNAIENTLDGLRRFLSKMEGDKRVNGGQKLTKDSFAYMSYYNANKDGERPGRVSRRDGDRRTGGRRKPIRSPSARSQSSGQESGGATRASSTTSSKGSSKSPSRRRDFSSDTSHSRASSTHSNVSSKRASPGRRTREKKEEKVKKKTSREAQESHYNDRSSRRRDERPEDRPTCPTCFEKECKSTEKDKKCQLRPDLIHNPEKTGPCGICTKGYHITVADCLNWPMKRAKMREQQRLNGGGSSSKN